MDRRSTDHGGVGEIGVRGVLRRSPLRGRVADSSHHDRECDSGIGGEIEADAHRNCGERAAVFSWIAAVREGLLHKLLDGCEKRFVRWKRSSFGHAETFAMAVPWPRRTFRGGQGQPSTH
jgi:hypothetical protein